MTVYELAVGSAEGTNERPLVRCGAVVEYSATALDGEIVHKKSREGVGRATDNRHDWFANRGKRPESINDTETIYRRYRRGVRGAIFMDVIDSQTRKRVWAIVLNLGPHQRCGVVETRLAI